MADRMAPLYYGDEFGYAEQKPYDLIHLWMQEGSVIEARMPTPTRKHPEKTKLVYKWIGERAQKIRDLSTQMPAAVTVKNAEGSYIHRMIVKAWAPTVRFA